MDDTSVSSIEKPIAESRRSERGEQESIQAAICPGDQTAGIGSQCGSVRSTSQEKLR
jgi:hypothetical protein